MSSSVVNSERARQDDKLLGGHCFTQQYVIQPQEDDEDWLNANFSDADPENTENTDNDNVPDLEEDDSGYLEATKLHQVGYFDRDGVPYGHIGYQKDSPTLRIEPKPNNNESQQNDENFIELQYQLQSSYKMDSATISGTGEEDDDDADDEDAEAYPAPIFSVMDAFHSYTMKKRVEEANQKWGTGDNVSGEERRSPKVQFNHTVELYSIENPASDREDGDGSFSPKRIPVIKSTTELRLGEEDDFFSSAELNFFSQCDSCDEDSDSSFTHEVHPTRAQTHDSSHQNSGWTPPGPTDPSTSGLLHGEVKIGFSDSNKGGTADFMTGKTSAATNEFLEKIQYEMMHSLRTSQDGDNVGAIPSPRAVKHKPGIVLEKGKRIERIKMNKPEKEGGSDSNNNNALAWTSKKPLNPSKTKVNPPSIVQPKVRISSSFERLNFNSTPFASLTRSVRKGNNSVRREATALDQTPSFSQVPTADTMNPILKCILEPQNLSVLSKPCGQCPTGIMFKELKCQILKHNVQKSSLQNVLSKKMMSYIFDSDKGRSNPFQHPSVSNRDFQRETLSSKNKSKAPLRSPPPPARCSQRASKWASKPGMSSKVLSRGPSQNSSGSGVVHGTEKGEKGERGSSHNVTAPKAIPPSPPPAKAQGSSSSLNKIQTKQSRMAGKKSDFGATNHSNNMRKSRVEKCFRSLSLNQDCLPLGPFSPSYPAPFPPGTRVSNASPAKKPCVSPSSSRKVFANHPPSHPLSSSSSSSKTLNIKVKS